MMPEKPKKGYLSRAFRGAVLTGLTAVTLVTGPIGMAYAQQGQDYWQPTSAMSDEGMQQQEAWQRDPNYQREAEALRRYYAAHAYEIQEREREAIARIRVYDERRALSSNRFIGVRLNNVPLLGTVFNSAAENGYVAAEIGRAHAYAVREAASLEAQRFQQQMALENRYRQAYERQHPPARMASAGDPRSFEEQKKQICEQRALRELGAGRNLPNGDACKAVLEPPPKL